MEREDREGEAVALWAENLRFQLRGGRGFSLRISVCAALLGLGKIRADLGYRHGAPMELWGVVSGPSAPTAGKGQWLGGSLALPRDAENLRFQLRGCGMA